ncbi:MAG: XdhC family protein, partial [Pseudomonadota bacterium]
GGAVTLRFTHDALEVDQPQALPLRSFDEPGRPISLWLWGAGHVGRAVVTMAPAKAFDITWADTDADRFPVALPDHINVLPAADLPLLAKSARGDAHHLIFTYSHDIDFALCAALLQRGTASIGLIGSYTKRARFFKRLRALGLDPSPITCPIGDKSLGKHPEQIAKGVLDVLLKPIAA